MKTSLFNTPTETRTFTSYSNSKRMQWSKYRTFSHYIMRTSATFTPTETRTFSTFRNTKRIQWSDHRHYSL
jgi:hypothetical protein